MRTGGVSLSKVMAFVISSLFTCMGTGMSLVCSVALDFSKVTFSLFTFHVFRIRIHFRLCRARLSLHGVSSHGTLVIWFPVFAAPGGHMSD
jgi:hypothetical protein